LGANNFVDLGVLKKQFWSLKKKSTWKSTRLVTWKFEILHLGSHKLDKKECPYREPEIKICEHKFHA